MTASRASGSGSGTKAPPEPLRDAFRHLLVDERGYVQILNTIVTVRPPLTCLIVWVECVGKCAAS